MGESPGYADITADDVLALRESARLEELTLLPSNSVFPPATLCWEVIDAKAIYSICVFQFANTILLGVAEDVFAPPLEPYEIEPEVRQLAVFVEYPGAKVYNDPERKLFYVVHGTGAENEPTGLYDFATLYWQRVLDHAKEQGWQPLGDNQPDA
jgi:hypothetical protein